MSDPNSKNPERDAALAAAKPDATGHGNNKLTEARHASTPIQESQQSRVHYGPVMNISGGNVQNYNLTVAQPAGGTTDPKSKAIMDGKLEEINVTQQDIKKKLEELHTDQHRLAGDTTDRKRKTIMDGKLEEMNIRQQEIKKELEELHTAGDTTDRERKTIMDRILEEMNKKQQEIKKELEELHTVGKDGSEVLKTLVDGVDRIDHVQQQHTEMLQQDMQKKDQTERVLKKLEDTAVELSDVVKKVPVSKAEGPTPEMQYVFRANYQALIDHMKIGAILAVLFERFILDHNDMEEIRALPTSRKKVIYLLNTLTKEENVKQMIEVLRATNQEALAQVLDQTPPEETPPKETPPEEAPPEETLPAKNLPEGTPPKETPPEETQPKETPLEETPPKEAPTEETLSAKNLSEETPSKETPPKETPPKKTWWPYCVLL